MTHKRSKEKRNRKKRMELKELSDKEQNGKNEAQNLKDTLKYSSFLLVAKN